MRIHDLRCKGCGALEMDVVCPTDRYPPCPLCRGQRTWIPSRVNTDTWGQSRYITSLDMEFGSKGDLKRHLKEHGLEEAGDKVGGARNESHLNLGKGFSYGGQAVRRSSGESAVRKQQS